ncbi:M17 family metallopeptidase [Methylotenera sp. L2L1]|uniref:M17 family metallopeptidase n=1 Tax=Methylotenera sp. L2L1 TaxID=1502770 RepID=UPI0005665D2B|nr:leucyl aminopeptidase family protein [Methylotenera sp. L2L1]
MSVKLRQNAAIANENTLKDNQHMLFVLSNTDDKNIPFIATLETKLKRSKCELKDLNKTPVVIDLPNGGVASYVILNSQLNMFQRHTLLRAAIKPIIAEQAETIDICVFGDDSTKEAHACAAYYVVTVNAANLPSRKKEHKPSILKSVTIHGYKTSHDYAYVNARVAGNTICRELTITPPNELTPTLYRQKIAKLAVENSWLHKEYDMNALKEMGAGAFVAVAQGSEPQDAAIVHLTYHPTNAQKHFSIVGKGICFDTGGHNLKPAKYMLGMHEDMNGSAVCLGILLAVSKMQLPIKLDCWLAIAQNHIGPNAFKQNDVITALNGLTVEIVHTDAEGRMVLADTLTLASREKPDAIIDFATLTGSMITALSDRMSGVIVNRPELAAKAIDAGSKSGERIASFPYDDDFDSDLDSDIADIKQCTLDGGADHIHAARFLGKFIENDIPWIHTDLSSANRKGGLGAVESDTNGFGVGFGLALIERLLN